MNVHSKSLLKLLNLHIIIFKPNVVAERMSKTKRHLKIREIITEEAIETQDAVVDRLDNLGFTVTQATVDPDIKRHDIVKVPADSGKYKYTMPTEQRCNATNKLKLLMIDLYMSIEHALHFI